MAGKLYVTAKFVAEEARIADMISLLEKLASDTRTEPGCLDYSYYQASDNPRVFTSIEVWETPDAEAAHWNTQHLKRALSQLPNFMEGEAEVTKYTKIA